jgi:transposase-like protein
MSADELLEVLSKLDALRAAPIDQPCPHTHDYYDRSFCPEPCGSQHYRCRDCGEVLEDCPLEDEEEEEER